MPVQNIVQEKIQHFKYNRQLYVTCYSQTMLHQQTEMYVRFPVALWP